jgi:hypothetical protein
LHDIADGEDGNIAIQIRLSEFYSEITNMTYTEFKREGVQTSLEFSPDQASLFESMWKHINSNLPQFFVPKAIVTITATDDKDWVNVSITNPTSRNSLLLHVGDNYNRDSNDNLSEKPLSTVTQTYNFRLKIDSSKFQKEEAAE